MHKRIIVALTIATLSITACIIGPKQDDPADIRTAPPDTSVDTNAEFAGDTAASEVLDPSTAPDAGGGGGDAKADADARDGDAADGDAADGDAVTDGADGG